MSERHQGTNAMANPKRTMNPDHATRSSPAAATAVTRQALLLGYYGANNLGDEMMLHCILPWMRRQNLEPSVISEDSATTETRYGVRAVPNTPMLGQWAWRRAYLGGAAMRLLREIVKSDCLVVGGGDLIRDDQGWKTFSYTMEKILTAVAFGKPVFLVNVGIGRPTTFWGRKMLKFALNRSAKIIVRDGASYDVVRKLRGTANLELLPDIVTTLPEALRLPEVQAVTEQYIVVSLREEPNAFGRYEFTDAHMSGLAALLDKLVDRAGVRIVFVPFQASQGQSDNRIHQQIANRMRRRGAAEIREWSPDVLELVNVMRGAQLVLGMRLHAVVLGVALRRPCAAMPYDQKVLEFASTVGLRALLEPSDLLSDGTAARLLRLMTSSVNTAVLGSEAWASAKL